VAIDSAAMVVSFMVGPLCGVGSMARPTQGGANGLEDSWVRDPISTGRGTVGIG
jgi:hypothetical protein